MDTTLVCIDIYTVREGDTLYSIAQMYDLPVSLLMKINCIALRKKIIILLIVFSNL